MGNQGMTNWKFSAFFAIALMLIAGLFSTTAMAADGDGAMAVTVTTPSDTNINNLEAGSIVTLRFSYDIPANLPGGETQLATRDEMDAGLIQLVIPAAWDFAAADTAAGITAANTGVVVTPADRRVSGVTDKTVRVELAGDFTEAQIITIANIVVPIPNRLTDGDRSFRYEEYEFTTSSRTRSGRLRKLDPIVQREADPNGDGDLTDAVDLNTDGDMTDTIVTITQPRVRVGNIGPAGSGKIAITPEKAYETYIGSVEGPHRFVIKFTADGPMWNSRVNILFPGEIDNLSPTDVKHLETATGSLTPTGNSGSFRLVNTGGAEVSFAGITSGLNSNDLTPAEDDGEGDAATIGTAQVVAIDVKAMDKGQGFEIVYYSKIPDVTTPMPMAFLAAASTRKPLGVDAVLPPPALLTAAITGGLLFPKNGSGTMMAVPMYVEIDSGTNSLSSVIQRRRS